ncbi:MAG: ATP-binding protein [Desulfobacterales bacterium]|nr:ATP-binding protein [Desulfobacterales bacterium]
MSETKDKLISACVKDYEHMGIGSRIRAKRIFYANLLMVVICAAFLPFAADEIWLVLIIAAMVVAGIFFSLLFLRAGRLNAAATVHLLATGYGISCLHIFISDSYADMLTFLALSFIVIAGGVLIATRLSQIFLMGGMVLLAQLLSPVINMSGRLDIPLDLQLESLALFVLFFTVLLLIKSDNRTLLKITQTENRKAGRAFRGLDTFFKNSGDAVIWWDTDQRGISCNDAALDLFGFSHRDDLAKVTITTLSAPRQNGGTDAAKEVERVLRTTREKGHHTLEWRFRRQDGSRFDTNIHLFCIDMGRRKRFQVTVDEPADQIFGRGRQIRPALQMMAGGIAAGLSKTVTDSTGGVPAVEVLANRLGSKTMRANLRAAESADTTMHAIHRYMKLREIPGVLNAIRGQQQKLTEVSDALLGFAGKDPHPFSYQDPVRLVEDAVALASESRMGIEGVNFKAIGVETEYDDNLPQVPCDREGIITALLNILENGARAMGGRGDGGKDYLPLFTLRVHLEKNAGMLRLEIEDNGPGMEDAQLKRIFEPCFTAGTPGDRLGMGLPIACFIVTHIHRGTLEASSTPGQGSNFILRLPFPATPGEKQRASADN